MSRRLRLLLVAFVVAVAALPVGAAPASAHAVLLSSDPAPGARVERSPASVTLRFSEPVEAGSRALQVLGPDGGDVATGDPVPGEDARAVAVALREGLPRGSYTVAWQIVSADGHPLGGTFTFGVGVPAGAAAAERTTDTSVALLRWTAQGLAYAGVALLLGCGVFGTVLWPSGLRTRGLRRLVVAGVALSAGSAVALFLLQGPYGAATGAGDVLDPELLGATAGSTLGRLLLLRLLAVLVAVPLLLPRQNSSVPPSERADAFSAVLVATVVLITFALSGHAGQGQPPWLSVGADALHLAAACVWLGGLAALAWAYLPSLREAADPDGDAAGVLPRWSRVAMAAVAVLVVTGTYQAWREIGSVGALTGSPYGRLVLGKVAGLAVLLVLAELGRRWVRGRFAPAAPGVSAPVRVAAAASVPGGTGASAGPAVATRTPGHGDADDREPYRRLRESVLSEVAIGVAVLAVTAILVSTVPGRQAYAPPFETTAAARDAEGGVVRVAVKVTPTRAGAQTITVRTTTEQGAVQPFRVVEGTLSPRDGGLGPVSARFAPSGPGEAVSRDVVVPAPGEWTLTVQVSVDELSVYGAAVDYTVR